MKTPLRFNNDLSSNAFYSHSEQKQSRIQKNLFASTYKQIPESPQSVHAVIDKRNQLLKRPALSALENQVNKEVGFTTPIYTAKRFKKDFFSESKIYEEQKSVNAIESGSDSDEKDEHNGGNDIDGNSAVNRKMRGLKILSVKVQELVQKKQ